MNNRTLFLFIGIKGRVDFVFINKVYTEIEMHKSLNKILLSVTIIAIFSACTTLKEVGKDIGQTTKKVTTEIGHATRDVAKETVKTIKEY